MSFYDFADIPLGKAAMDEFFIKLIADMHLILEETPPQAPAQDDATRAFDLEVDGVHFVIGYAPDIDDVNVLIQCSFGSVPTNMAAEVLKYLMNVNLALAFQNQGGFAIDPSSDEVILIYRTPLALADASSLMYSIELCAAQANRWRRTYFLDKAEEEKADFVLFNV